MSLEHAHEFKLLLDIIFNFKKKCQIPKMWTLDIYEFCREVQLLNWKMGKSYYRTEKSMLQEAIMSAYRF